MIKCKLSCLIVISQISIFTTANALEVSVNGSENLALIGSVVYNQLSNPRSIGFQVADPIVCSSTSASTAPTILKMNDANNIPVNSLNTGILAIEYNLAKNTFGITTDDSIQCATETGLHGDRIYNHGFEVAENDAQITLLDGNGNPFAGVIEVSDQQVFNYQYRVDNNGDSTITTDLVEYFKANPALPFFSGVAGDDWICTEVSAGGSTTSCGGLAAGEATVDIQNAIIEPGEQLLIMVSRTVEIPAGTVGTAIDLLAAVFVHTVGDSLPANNISFKSIGTTNNNQPTISAVADVAVLEDNPTGIINFTIGDVETDEASLIMTAQSSDTAVVPVGNIAFGGAGANRTVQITPNADANTGALPVTITLIVDDGISTAQQSFDLTVTSVNDQPSFTLMNVPDWPAGTVGLKTLKGFVENLDYGASADESSQSVLNTTITVQSDPNGIFSVGGEPQLTNNGVLTYFLSGSGGTANIDVVIQDDGGTANGGNDTSDVVSFTITVLNTLPTITAINAQSFDEDNNSNTIAFTVGDAETAVGDLTLTATSSDPSIVQVAGIVFTGAGANRNVQIIPEADQNTVISGDVTITVIVSDGSDTAQSQFAVTINPINDAPSFDVGSDISWPSASVGLKQHASYASNIQMGPTIDEDNSQSVSSFNTVITGDAIFGTGGNPVFDSSGSLAYVLNGNTGIATIEVTLTDDGGIANGGIDTSGKRIFTITVQ